jgi:adenine-specific DNA-methyltransferase
MSYIDPPYTTGNDFIYPDDYTESLQTYLEYTGQVDAQGKKFNTNTEADGRFHSKWLNMMYPRLYLARNLLREDRVIFISIDDMEAMGLRSLLNDIFGEENFLGQLVWHSKKGGGGAVKTLVTEHEYILVYTKGIPENALSKLEVAAQPLDRHDEKGPYRKGRELNKWGAASARADRPTMFFSIPGPNGEEVYPIRNDATEGRWRFGPKTMLKFVQEGNSLFESRPDGTYIVYEKIRSTEPKLKAYRSLLTDPQTAADGTSELKVLFGGKTPFDFPKPTLLIDKLIEISGAEDEDLILDFFAGSGTTAHAILALNQRNGSTCKFILVQLPEPTGRDDYPTIADITKERVRRVIRKLDHEDEGKLPFEGEQQQDRGFRVFKLAESNFETWDANIAPGDVAALQQQLELHIDHIRDSRTAEDILYEILLKNGFPLTTPVEQLTLAGKIVYSVAGGALFICLERQLTLDLVRAMAEHRPERVVCLDNGFTGNDQLKANAVQLFKNKGVTSFKTV